MTRLVGDLGSDAINLMENEQAQKSLICLQRAAARGEVGRRTFQSLQKYLWLAGWYVPGRV